MRYVITISSLLLLGGCAQTEILGCPEVREWSEDDQAALLEEISRPRLPAGVPGNIPGAYRIPRHARDQPAMRATEQAQT
jgi:hypothetical protein